jgi:hypothetical protein
VLDDPRFFGRRTNIEMLLSLMDQLHSTATETQPLEPASDMLFALLAASVVAVEQWPQDAANADVDRRFLRAAALVAKDRV